MGARIFTDDEGNKFELVDRNPWAIPEVLAIKPIKAVEKKEYRFELYDVLGAPDAGLYKQNIYLSEPIAQKVAAAIEALMEWLQRDSSQENYSTWDNFMELLHKARAAFQEDV